MKSSHFACVLAAFIATLIKTSYADGDEHRCDHPNKDTGYPPKIFHHVFNKSVVDQYDEVMILGDVHGCLTELKLLLKKANATGNNVLKIIAGDITRKGPDSIGVLRYVRDTPSMHSVRGNNDQKVLMRHFKHHHFNYKLKKKDQFIKNMTHADFHYLEHLPYSISLPSLSAVVVHGGLRAGVPLRHNQPYDIMNLKNYIRDPRCAGGYRAHDGDDKGDRWAPYWPGPVHVFFGHNKARLLQIARHATGLDTGLVNGGYLTGVFIKGVRKNQVVQQKALKEYA